jgi:hypothetical protein
MNLLSELKASWVILQQLALVLPEVPMTECQGPLSGPDYLRLRLYNEIPIGMFIDQWQHLALLTYAHAVRCTVDDGRM